MSGRIKEAHILHVDLPLRKKFKHAITTRTQSDSVFLRLLLEDGTVGYGESLPREYVTEETPQSVIKELKEIIKRNVLEFTPRNYHEAPIFINGLDIKKGAARCVLELALLDTYGKYFKTPISSIIGAHLSDRILYSGVIHAGSLMDTVKLCLAFKAFKIHFIKIKVGVGNDTARLNIARNILGRDTNIRVDANCAWSTGEAIENINRLRQYDISAVEQPVGASDYEGLKKITDFVPETIIADESICTIDDAKRLAEMRACNMFNVRISKCGGILNSLKIADIAREHGIGVQLGCQVGESGLLSAAGWHFASILGNLVFCEGSYGRLLLKEDITKEDMTIRRGGIGRPVSGPGLGVNILDNILNRYIISKEVIG